MTDENFCKELLSLIQARRALGFSGQRPGKTLLEKSGVAKEAKIDGQMALIAQSCPCTIEKPTDHRGEPQTAMLMPIIYTRCLVQDSQPLLAQLHSCPDCTVCTLCSHTKGRGINALLQERSCYQHRRPQNIIARAPLCATISATDLSEADLKIRAHRCH